MLTSCQVLTARSHFTLPLPFNRAHLVTPLQVTPLRSYQRRNKRLGLAQAPLVVSPQRVVPCLHLLLATQAPEVWTSHIGTAAVLIVDATNRASVSAADARAYKHAGATLHGTFKAWLVYLRDLLQPELCIAVFDPPQGAPGSRRQLAVPEYRQARHAKAQRQRTAAQTSSTQQPQHQQQRSRVTHLQSVAKAVGYAVAEATDGWEADDVIGALCAAANVAGQQQADGDGRHWSVVVASADSDFAGILSRSVAWLQLLRSSRSCPRGCQLVTAEEFEAEHGFPASAHAAFLALTGKREAGICGIGIGERAAGKLVSRYHTIGAILGAAERGELAGWGANVRRAFSGSNMASTAEILQRNAAAVGICQDTSVLEPALAAAVQATITGSARQAQRPAADAGSDHKSTCGAAIPAEIAADERARQLAWMHPDAALRWRLVQPHAQALGAQLAAAGIPHAVQHALRNGCIIDLAVFGHTGALGSEGAAITAVMLRTAADMLPSCVGSAAEANLKTRLTARALQHRRLLAGMCNVVIDVDCTGVPDPSNIVATYLQQ